MARNYFAELLGEKPELPPFAKKEQTDENKNHQAIGEFIVAYAYAEIALHILARKLTGLKDAKARLFFGGSRIGDVSEKIKSLLTISKRASKTIAMVKLCLKQFDVIGSQRDKIVHRAATGDLGKISISNLLTAKSILHAEVDHFTITDLNAMTTDCHVIYLLLATVFSPKRRHSDVVRRLLRMPDPWLYKPPQQPKKPKRSRPHRAKPARPHQS